MVLDAPCSYFVSEQFGLRLRGRGMVFRTAGAIATLLIGLGSAGGQALAQYYPPPRTYPPQAYPPAQGYRPQQALPPMADADADDDTPPLNAPVLQERAASRHPIRARNSRLSRRCRTAAVRRSRAGGCRNAPLLWRARRHPTRPSRFGRTGCNSAGGDAAAAAD
jgi:hypothetical protein